MAVTMERRSLPLVESGGAGLTVMTGVLDRLLEWGVTSSLWVFPMATSCCGIELMAAAASRVDLDRMGTIVRASPRQADVMVVAGTITTEDGPTGEAALGADARAEVGIAMGSCAISGDFYRNLYSVVPGIDTLLPVDVYVPGCPPNPEALMDGLLRLKEKVAPASRAEPGTEIAGANEMTRPAHPAHDDPARPPRTRDIASTGSAPTPRPRRECAADEAPSMSTTPLRDAGSAAPRGRRDRPAAAAPYRAANRTWSSRAACRATGYRQLVYVVAAHFPEKTGAKAQTEASRWRYALRSHRRRGATRGVAGQPRARRGASRRSPASSRAPTGKSASSTIWSACGSRATPTCAAS